MATDTTEQDETTEPVETPEATEPEQPEANVANEHSDPESEPETFPRDYVEKLRRESAGYRDKAKRADDLATRLHTALVSATGRLADPTDLPFDEAHLDDPDALTAAVDVLLAAKPHLANRRPVGNVGQGASGDVGGVSLAGLLRAGAA